MKEVVETYLQGFREAVEGLSFLGPEIWEEAEAQARALAESLEVLDNRAAQEAVREENQRGWGLVPVLGEWPEAERFIFLGGRWYASTEEQAGALIEEVAADLGFAQGLRQSR